MANYQNYPGLSYSEIEVRKARGEANTSLPPMTRSLKQIFLENSLTFFNLLNIIIAGFVVYTGSYKNLLFLGVILLNTVLGIFQEMKAKKSIDQLSLLNQAKVKVIRNGQESEIFQDEVVKNELILLKRGQQLVVDGRVLETSGLECDESQLTGEAEPIIKKIGDTVFSGSFVVSGDALIEATAVGEQSFSAKLTLEAKGEKSVYSALLKNMRKTIRLLTFVIIPIGALLFLTSIWRDMHLNQAILGATAAMIGMIPEGLVLLTTGTLAVGVLNLTRKRVLVKTMGSIETLARIDTLCLDKTGTLTSGELKVIHLETIAALAEAEVTTIISQVAAALAEDNATGLALTGHFPLTTPSWAIARSIPFSSARKWSGVEFSAKNSVYIGAPEYLFNELSDTLATQIHRATKQGLRVLAVATSDVTMSERSLPPHLELIALIYLEDEIRPEAPQTLAYFKEQGVSVCIISGDHPQTVAQIAKRAGVSQSERLLDMSQVPEEADYRQLVQDYRVFGRVSPTQKSALVAGLQANGGTVGMTGDGVNDILALKQADCSIVMANGSDATKGIADFVLLDSNFDSMVEVVLEGRKVVNNIQRVASLYLTKTTYSICLALLFIFINAPYPFQPIQLSPISILTVGIPSFFLALRPNIAPIKGRFFQNVLEPALASGLSVVVSALAIHVIGNLLGWRYEESSTVTVLLTGMICFIALHYVAQPLNWPYRLMIGLLIGLFGLVFTFFGGVFSLVSIYQWPLAAVYLPLIALAVPLFYSLKYIAHHLLGNHRER